MLEAPFYDQQSNKMLALMCEFEQTVRLALTARSAVSGLAVDASAEEELLSVIEDLTWALLQRVSVDGTRMVHYFQTAPFPVPRGWRDPFPVETLSRADVSLRRSVLAVVACLLRPRQFADLTRTAPPLCLPSRYSELLRHLGTTRADWLLSQAHRWPMAFREQMERAA